MTGVVKSQENHVHVLILHGFAALLWRNFGSWSNITGKPVEPNALMDCVFYTAFATLLPKCKTRLKRKSPIAPLHIQWIREAVSMCCCSTLKQLRAFRQKFNMMWDLFHKYVKQLDFSNIRFYMKLFLRHRRLRVIVVHDLFIYVIYLFIIFDMDM